jgi:hypothetical protein
VDHSSISVVIYWITPSRRRRSDFVAAVVSRSALDLVFIGPGFGFGRSRLFEAATSDNSYASRSQPVTGASTSSRCLM